jgi:hypothetical protein
MEIPKPKFRGGDRVRVIGTIPGLVPSVGCVMGVLLAAAAFAQSNDAPPQTVRPAVTRAVQAIQSLTSQLRDPDSLVITGVFTSKYASKKDKGKPDNAFVCVYYRARNGMGGYTNGVEMYPNSFLAGLGGKLDNSNIPDGCKPKDVSENITDAVHVAWQASKKPTSEFSTK